jgi:hypothetical protein
MTRLPGNVRVPALLCALALSSACGSGKLPLPDGDVEPPISVDRILDDPEDFIGRRLRLSARVAEAHGTRAFTLKDDDPVMKEQMLVVTRRPIGRLLGEEQTTLKAGDELLVSGIVRPGDLAAIEAELGVDLEPKLEDRFRGKPVLVASEVVRTDSKEPEEPDTANPGY